MEYLGIDKYSSDGPCSDEEFEDEGFGENFDGSDGGFPEDLYHNSIGGGYPDKCLFL
jgi:hypothetical protein